MSPSPFTYGLIDGSQGLKPAHRDDQIEMLDIDKATRFNCPLPWRGMHFGSGAANKPPVALEDGVFLSLQAADTTKTPSGYGSVDPFGTAPSLAHGSQFYDFAPDPATLPVYMVFSAGTIFITGSDNFYWLTDADGAFTSVKNPNYNPGQFGSESVTGLTGAFRCWYPKRLTYESSLSGYAPGSPITVTKGRAAVASGNFCIGRVEIVDTLKVLISFDLKNPHSL